MIVPKKQNSGSSDAKNSLMQHNGYRMKQWVFGLIPHMKIQNLIVRRWDRWKSMTGIRDKLENFKLSDVKEQLRVVSPTEGDDPDERSKHGVPRQQDLTQQQPPTESPPQKTTYVTTVIIATIETAITQGSTTTTISPRTKTTHETRRTKTTTSTRASRVETKSRTTATATTETTSSNSRRFTNC